MSLRDLRNSLLHGGGSGFDPDATAKRLRAGLGLPDSAAAPGGNIMRAPDIVPLLKGLRQAGAGTSEAVRFGQELTALLNEVSGRQAMRENRQ